MTAGTLPIPVAERRQSVANGSAMAAFLAAGIGAVATGAVVLLNEMGIFSAPALYTPAGGVSGRTTLAAVIWLCAWGILHRLWRNRDVPASRIRVVAFALVAIGVGATFPPVWRLF